MAESQIFLAPCASDRPQEHFQSTVRTAVSRQEYGDHVDANYSDYVSVWGVTSGRESTWNKINEGDYLLFYWGEETYRYAAKVIGTEKSEELGVEIWPDFDSQTAGGADSTDPWGFLIFLEPPIPIEIDGEELHGYAGHNRNFAFDFSRLNEEGLSAIREDFDSIGEFIQERKSQPDIWCELSETGGRAYREDGPLSRGRSLLSPRRNKQGHDIYAEMREIEVGDIVLHVSLDDGTLQGLSEVASALRDDFEGPPDREARWSESQIEEKGYLRELENHTQLSDPFDVKAEFLQHDDYADELTAIREEYSRLFFDRNFNFTHEYLTRVPPELSDLLIGASSELRREIGARRRTGGITHPDEYDDLEQARRLVTTELEIRGEGSWLEGALTRSIVADWTDALSNLAFQESVSPTRAVRLEQIRELYQSNQDRLEYQAAEWGIGTLYDLNEPQTLFTVLLREIQEEIGPRGNVDHVKMKTVLTESYARSRPDIDAEAEHFLIDYIKENRDEVLVHKFAAPPDYWMTCVQKGAFSIEEGRENQLEAVSPGDVFLIHSNQETSEAYDLGEDYYGLLGVGIVGARIEKNELWWWDEINEGEVFPYVFKFAKAFVTGNLGKEQYAWDFVNKPHEERERDLLLLTENVLPTSQVEEVCSELPGAGYPLSGQWARFRTQDGRPGYARPLALLEELAPNLTEIPVVNLWARLENPIDLARDEILSGLHFQDDHGDEILSQVESALSSGKHLIFTGPPGTGKTKIANGVAKSLVENYPNLFTDATMTTATADWSTFDTVGGYMPRSEENESGNLEFQPGILLNRFRSNATGAPIGEPVVIDELNRADIDKAFGQLFTVLSNQSVELPYTIGDKAIEITTAEDLDGPPKAHQFAVPQSWRIFATMNTYDKTSLYEMSYAFMRRFAFIRVSAPELPDDDQAVEDLMLEYINAWDDVERDRDIATEVGLVWRATNSAVEGRAIGPAIVKDMLMYITAHESSSLRDRLTEAVISFIFPQLEGVPKRKQILTSIADVPRINRDMLDDAARDMLQESIQERNE